MMRASSAGEGTAHGLDLTSADRRRIARDRVATGLCVAAAIVLAIVLGVIVGYVVVSGLPSLTPDLIVEGQVDYDQGGAFAAIAGSLQIVPLALVIAGPIGILGGVLLAERGGGRVAAVVRTAVELLNGLPPIVVGIFVFLVMVAPVGGYSAFAGIVAVAIVILPLVVRSVEEVLVLVPGSVREAALALGIPPWRTTISVVVRGAIGGILTALMLAVARGAGETASLTLTSYGGGQVVNIGDLAQPMDALPTFIYYNATQPSDILVGQAWGASLLLLAFIFVVNLLVRGRRIGSRAV